MKTSLWVVSTLIESIGGIRYLTIRPNSEQGHPWHPIKIVRGMWWRKTFRLRRGSESSDLGSLFASNQAQPRLFLIPRMMNGAGGMSHA